MKRNTQTQSDIQLLERQLESARLEQAPGEVIQLLEWKLEKARREQDRLIQQLVHQYSGACRTLATRLVGRNDGDDVAQEAFVSLLRWIMKKSLPEVKARLESPEGLQNLVRRITSCRAYDFLRKQGRREEQEEDGEAIESIVDDASMLHPQTAIDIARLERAYAALPPAQRVAHVLHHYYGFTDADFETTLGFTKTNSRTLICRANLALKRAMEKKQ